MADALKHLINADTVHWVGEHLQRVWPGFPRPHFDKLALDNLESLPFKARADRLAEALGTTLPDDFQRAADLLDATLRPVVPPQPQNDPDDQTGGQPSDMDGLSGWALWGVGTYVARHGLEHPERALATLHGLTQRFTAEFAIRPFILKHPERVWPVLARWVDDPSAHVRRLVSEGTRPRLPWGLRLQPLVADPRPSLPLLQALQDDPTGYVRRSVANHLNDIAKDHPGLVVDWLRAHRPGASVERERLLRHASRTLIKAGHTDALAVWGLGEAFIGDVQWSVSPCQVRVGARVALSARLQSRAARPQAVALDYVVHHARPSGRAAVKVFKGTVLQVDANDAASWQREHALKATSTRALYPGPHRIELQLNGQRVAEAWVDVTT